MSRPILNITRDSTLELKAVNQLSNNSVFFNSVPGCVNTPQISIVHALGEGEREREII